MYVYTLYIFVDVGVWGLVRGMHSVRYFKLMYIPAAHETMTHKGTMENIRQNPNNLKKLSIPMENPQHHRGNPKQREEQSSEQL